jgi:uncharacterized membrane protein
MNKKMKGLVIGSLLLNVLLVGYVIGEMSHQFRGEYLGRRGGGELVSRLPKEKATLFFETLEGTRRQNRHVFRQIREAREEAIRILGASEFDAAAYRRQIEKLHRQRGLMKQHLADATIELAKQFNQEERQALAQHLRHSRYPREKKDSGNTRKPYREDP